MSWYNQYFTPEWEKRFRRQARKTFSNHPERVDDAVQTTWIKLFENLKKAKKKNISDAYVMAAYKNLLIDEYRHHFRRCVARTWVKRLGGIWERIAVILCQENIPAHAIALKIKAETEGTETPGEDEVDFIVRKLKSKEYCTTLGSREVQTPEGVEFGDERSMSDKELPKNELAFLVQLILGGKVDDSIQTRLSEHIIEQWQPLQKTLTTTLTDDDRLILVLIFTEGFTLDKTAQALNKSKSKIRYQLKQVLQTIQRVLKQHKIDLSLLVD